MKIHENWAAIKKIFNQAFKSSFHYALATVNGKGEPHVTPIGSLILREPGHAIYFEEFTRQLPDNARQNNRVCVLAVNSSRWMWLRSLIKGNFDHPPALRLYGTLGESRAASEVEIKLWQRRVRWVRFTKGYTLMWKNMRQVRDVYFSETAPVHMGQMTRHR